MSVSITRHVARVDLSAVTTSEDAMVGRPGGRSSKLILASADPGRPGDHFYVRTDYHPVFDEQVAWIGYGYDDIAGTYPKFGFQVERFALLDSVDNPLYRQYEVHMGELLELRPGGIVRRGISYTNRDTGGEGAPGEGTPDTTRLSKIHLCAHQTNFFSTDGQTLWVQLFDGGGVGVLDVYPPNQVRLRYGAALTGLDGDGHPKNLVTMSGTNLLVGNNIDGKAHIGGPIDPAEFTADNLPSATTFAGCAIRVSNGDAGLPCLAFARGGQWLRVPLGDAVAAS